MNNNSKFKSGLIRTDMTQGLSPEERAHVRQNTNALQRNAPGLVPLIALQGVLGRSIGRNIADSRRTSYGKVSKRGMGRRGAAIAMASIPVAEALGRTEWGQRLRRKTQDHLVAKADRNAMMKQASRSASYIAALIKKAAPAGKAEASQGLSRADIDKARLNPNLMRVMRMRSSVAVPLKGDELLAIRRLARKNLPLMRQRQPKLTETQFYDKLVALVESRRPEMRKRLIAEIKAQFG